MVIGGGLAGCEAAYQLGRRGVDVSLWEMRPQRGTEAHKTDRLAELVCSNSFRDNSMGTAVGLLKAEMRAMDSLVMRVADRVSVPAGSALAVDRVAFAEGIEREIAAVGRIRLIREEVVDVPAEGITVVATGPLTSETLCDSLTRVLGCGRLYFYDAISPIITAASIDMDIAFRAARYGKGGDDYINCPLDEEQYGRLVDEISGAEKMPAKNFERCVYFEGCMPVEELARRGRLTLAFGPMKPVGLVDPRSERRPFAVVQLRQDDRGGRLYGMVGFQTKMTYPEQRRVFRMIPGLGQAEFVRLGSLHRNTFIDSPRCMTTALAVRGREDLFVGGQLVGVEGYVESAATGLLCGINAARAARRQPPVSPPSTTALGALTRYVTEPTRKHFQPMNANYGLFPPLESRVRGREKRAALGRRASRHMEQWMDETGLGNSSQLV